MRLVLATLLTLTFCAPVASQVVDPTPAYLAPQVSVIHLVSRPEQYDGKRVKLFGYLHVRFEDSALYLSKDDADYLTGANAIWVSGYDPAAKLEPIDGVVKDLRYFDGRYVMLEGFFKMKERGHMGMFSGGIGQIVRVLELQRWYDGRKELTKFDERGRIKPKRRRR
jgi:hypothetical protein